MSSPVNGNGKGITGLVTAIFGGVLTAAIVFVGQQSFKDHDSIIEMRVKLERIQEDLRAEKERREGLIAAVENLKASHDLFLQQLAKIDEKSTAYFEIDSRNMLARISVLERLCKE